MEGAFRGSLWGSVVELTKGAQQKGSDPLLWVIQLSSNLNSMGVSLPSVELANVLVSHICWENNVPIAWKFLEKALMLKIVPPMLVLALLSQRVIPSRRSQPVAYRLYMELLKRHIFTLKSQINGPNYQIIMKSIESVLHLSWNFGFPASDPGILVVEFLFSIVWQLVDASLDDEGFLNCTREKKSKWAIEPQEMEIDCEGSYYVKRSEHNEMLLEANTVMAIEIIGQFLQNNATSRILDLARRNLPVHWTSFTQRLQMLASNSLTLRNSKTLTAEALINLTSDGRMVLPRECKTTSLLKYHAVMAYRSLTSAGLCHGASRSALWLPLDLVLEDAMDGYQVDATSAVEVITGLVKTLRAINSTSWHDTFLGLWIAALRLVQRERYPIEGPVPRLDTRLCMLLSITTLVVADLIEEEEIAPTNKNECGSINHWKEKEVLGLCRNDLVSSLQTLGDYQGLLTPPQSVVSAANQAAAKAILILSGVSAGSRYFECISMKDVPTNFSGNMRHLIVEACIARSLLDTSAYSWPGYVNGRINQLPHGMPTQGLDWSSFMLGAMLTPAMANSLVSSPASRTRESI